MTLDRVIQELIEPLCSAKDKRHPLAAIRKIG
jgi:hypothetical protein